MPGFFSPGIAPGGHDPAALPGRNRPPWCPAVPGPRAWPPDAWAVVRVSHAGRPGPRALDRGQVAAIRPVRWPWAALPGARFAGRVCVCVAWSPVFVIPTYKHPGPRRLVRDPRALVALPGARALVALPGARALGRAPGPVADGPRARAPWCLQRTPRTPDPKKRAGSQAAPALALFYTVCFT